MKIRFTRIGLDLELLNKQVTTLQIEDRTLFTRIVQSLLSERGEEALEPYILLDGDIALSPKKAFYVVHELPNLPLNDKSLITALYRKIQTQSELDSERYEHIRTLTAELVTEIEKVSDSLWGNYATSSEGSLDTFLKALGFQPIAGEDYSLLDNCIRFIELLSDVASERPAIFVNPKSFFSQNEVEELFDKAIFLEKEILFLESWVDKTSYVQENKIVFDQDFLVL